MKGPEAQPECGSPCVGETNEAAHISEEILPIPDCLGD